MSPSVTIIDYGSGNICSVIRALEHCGATPMLADDPQAIDTAERLILPGVGAFADGMAGLRDRGLVEPIRRYARSGRPLLGICLGMQMLASGSEEFGEHEGLDVISGRVIAIPNTTVDGAKQKIPYIGWSALTRPPAAHWEGSPLQTLSEGASVYLVHSYHVVPDRHEHLLAQYSCGGHDVTAAIIAGRISGCQFHPEKSGKIGLAVLSSFLEI